MYFPLRYLQQLQDVVPGFRLPWRDANSQRVAGLLRQAVGEARLTRKLSRIRIQGEERVRWRR